VLTVESNPVALAVIMMLFFDFLCLLMSWKVRHVSHRGLLGEWKETDKRAFSFKPKAFYTQYVQPILAKYAPGWKTKDRDRNAIVPRAASKSGDTGAPLALEGAEEAPPSPKKKLPTLLASLQVEGELATFDDAAMLRRLATLVGVPDSNVGAVLSNGIAPRSIVIDAEVGCPDATTLVMAAKMLKTGIGALGLALGVKVLERPRIEVMPMADEATSGDDQKSPNGESSPKRRSYDRLAEAVIPTIQERIPALGGSSRKVRSLSPSSERKPPSGAHISPGPSRSASSKDTLVQPYMSGVVDPSDPGGGIQERIPLPGFGAARRSAATSALRLRSAATSSAASVLSSLGIAPDEDAGRTGLPFEGPGMQPVAVARSLSDGIQERLPVRPSMRRRAGNSAGRLGNALAIGEDPVLPPLSTACANGISQPPPQSLSLLESLTPRGVDLSMPIPVPVLQERVPRLGRAPPPSHMLPALGEESRARVRAEIQAVDRAQAVEHMQSRAGAQREAVALARAAYMAAAESGATSTSAEWASPPPSPPQIMPAHARTPCSFTSACKGGLQAEPAVGASTTVLTAKGDVDVNALSNASTWVPRLQERIPKFALQTSPGKVMPLAKTWVRPARLEETWDDRSPTEIAWGAAREHTLFGCLATILWGGGPKLASVAQALQLLWASLFGLLYLSCLQLRFHWLGGAWVSVPDGASLLERLSVVSAVAFGAALVCWPCTLVGRWLFLLANRVQKGSIGSMGMLVEGMAWAIVLSCCLAIAISTMFVSSRMEAEAAREDAMIAWALAMGTQWLVIEPLALVVFALVGMLLKWCTDFEDSAAPSEKGKGSAKGSSQTVLACSTNAASTAHAVVGLQTKMRAKQT